MAIVQETFLIPESIETGIATGLYRRIGGVIRYASGPNKGQIVKHLKPLKLSNVENGATGILAKIRQLTSKNKKAAIFIGAGIVVTVGGIIIYKKEKYKEPEDLKKFRESLKIYVDAVRNGTMDSMKIENVINSLDNLRENENYENICVQLTAEDIMVLLKQINDYTLKLFDDNDADFEKDNTSINNSYDMFNDFEKCLINQKKLFSLRS